MSPTVDAAAVAAWKALLGSERAHVVKNGLVIVETYADERSVNRAKNGGFPSTSSRKFGKVWTVSVRVSDLVDHDAGVIDGVTNDR